MGRLPAPGDPCGLVVVDKAAGPTSHDVVDRLRRLYRTRRVGHAGTLDPPATGILLVGLGRATRILAFLQALPKTYRAVIAFGTTTTTLDAAGTVLTERPCTFGPADLEAGVAALVGEISQVPPMVSAVRVGGERLYEAARRGEEVDRPARQVTVYRFGVDSFDPVRGQAAVTVACSSGTFIRTLAADLGESLGCGAHLHSLRRASIGSFGEDEAVSVAQLELMPAEELGGAVLPMHAALRDLVARRVEGEERTALGHGRRLPVADAQAAGEGDPVAVLDGAGQLLAVYRRSGPELVPAAVLVEA